MSGPFRALRSSLPPSLRWLETALTGQMPPQTHFMVINNNEIVPTSFAESSNNASSYGGSGGAPERGTNETGHVYNGEMPPMMWIEREQQRIQPIPASATSTGGGGNNNNNNNTNSGNGRGASSMTAGRDGSAVSPSATVGIVDDGNAESQRLRQEGNRAFREGRYTEAIRLYTSAIAADANSAVNYTNRSFAFYKVGAFDHSMQDARKAIELSPRFYKGHYRLGLAQMAVGDYNAALDSLRTAVSYAPGENKEELQVMVAKCESKLARAPVTPLLMNTNTTNNSSANGSMHNNNNSSSSNNGHESAFSPLVPIPSRQTTNASPFAVQSPLAMTGNEELGAEAGAEASVRAASLGANALLPSTVASNTRDSAGLSVASLEEYAKLSALVAHAGVAREVIGEYYHDYGEERSLLECRERSQRIRHLMATATSGQLSQLTRSAQEAQETLRRTLKSEQRGEYFAAKKQRDEAYKAVWAMADAVDKAIAQLRQIAKDESDFFQRFLVPGADEAAQDEEPAVGKEGTHAPDAEAGEEREGRQTTEATAAADGMSCGSAELSQASAQSLPSPAAEVLAHGPQPVTPTTNGSALPTTNNNNTAGTAGSSNNNHNNNETGAVEDSKAIAELLRRRDEIATVVRQTARYTARTDAAARALLQALSEEQAARQRLLPMLAEAKRVNRELQAYARNVARTSSKELTAARLAALDEVSAAVSRIRLDKSAFEGSLQEGERLLEAEAKLEQERLLYERQRINLQAEVEWLKVRDMPEYKINGLQNHVTLLKRNTAEVNRKQAEVQRRLLELINADHPELAWKSLASGSRILSLVKGSGLWLNLSFSDFQVVGTLSSTINSKVYHATRRGEHVALKEIAVDTEQARRRFQREVDIVAACTHPNIIRIKGVFFDGPFAYILMPYYYRGSVKAWLAKKEPLSWVAIQDLFRQLATAMAYLHERGIVHGDIKPSNILLADDGRPVVSDFGIAKDYGRLGELADVTMTQTSSGGGAQGGVSLGPGPGSGGGHALLGTINYMAPEQLREDKRSAATGLSDIWALGLTMYEIAASNASLLDASLGEVVMPEVRPEAQRVAVHAKRVGGDERLADLISSALTVDPQRRSSAFELLAHPYFSSSTHVVQLSEGYGASSSNALARSDERLEAVRAYIHAVRQAQQHKVLVSVSRNRMVDSLQQIFARLDEQDTLGSIMVVFQGEAGIDEGALTTEMLNLFYEQLVNDKHALVCAAMQETADITNIAGGNSAEPMRGSDYFNSETFLPAADDTQPAIPVETFELLGKVLLKNVIENRPLPLRLNSAIVKYFCGVEPSLLDLEEYDAALCDSLKRLQLLSSEDLGAAEVTFEHFTPGFLQTQYDGKYTTETVVHHDNVRDYIALRVLYDMTARRATALEAMKRGFYSIQSLNNHLKLLSPFDLLLLLCGVQHLSAQMVVDSLDFQGFPRTSRTPELLKEALLAMSQNNLRRFLLLCTSSAALPALNTMRKIKVVRGNDLDRLPVGHGCVQQLDLPDYNSKEVLQEKLDIALAHISDGFHII